MTSNLHVIGVTVLMTSNLLAIGITQSLMTSNLLVIGVTVLDDAIVGPLGAGDVLVLVRGVGEEPLSAVESVLRAGVAARK